MVGVVLEVNSSEAKIRAEFGEDDVALGISSTGVAVPSKRSDWNSSGSDKKMR